jgi:hypothetical protein
MHLQRRPTRAIALSALLLVLVAASSRAHAYAFLLLSGSGGRIAWHWDPSRLSDGRISWWLSGSVGANVIGNRDPAAAIAAAFARWEGIETSGARFSYQGVTNTRDRHPSDGRNLVALGSVDSLGTGVLAATFVTGDRDGRLTDVDIVFSHDVPFTTGALVEPGRYDLESVATHEIGHMLGLDHSGLVRATMAPFTDQGDDHQRTPESDDRIGATLLYPEGDVLARAGSLAGRITLDGRHVFLAHVVATSIDGPVVAAALSAPDGSYRIDGLPPGTYVVHAERLDGPVVPGNVEAFRRGHAATETTGYATRYH